MRSALRFSARLRALHFETLEDRIVLSGRSPADIFLDDWLLDPPSDATPQVEVALADVNDQFGVTYARNAYGFAGSGQTVAVIDSGVAYDHHYLGGGLGASFRVVGGRDFTEENDFDPYDDGPAGFHGTHVAGIIGSSHQLYQGVAPGVDIVAVRVFNDAGASDFNKLEQALRWVHDHRDSFAYPITTVNLSLGASYNGDSVPAWATVEEELSQLEQDGMFLSVAAGNGFASYNAPGLSYPAASPYVVPVASVGSDGLLSGFSQRHSRVLAAPGEQITSTVPDYLFSFDGVPNDFAEATGTSMAAPYVAGASVLVREALQFVGHTGITQDTIYGYLRDNADTVYDTATHQSYQRINLQATLDAIMPADDYGSAASSPQQLGTVVSGTSLTGLIGRMDDTDFFRFTAGATGVATVSATPSDSLETQWQLIGADGQIDGDSVTFDVEAGHTYTVGLGTSGGIGHYRLDVGIEQNIVDWGAIGYARSAGQVVQDEARYRLTAAHCGVLVVDAAFSRGAGDIHIDLYNEAGAVVAAGTDSPGGERLQLRVSAGETFVVQATGSHADLELRATTVATMGGSVSATLVADFTNDGFADLLVRAEDGTWWLTSTSPAGCSTEFWGRWSATRQWSDVKAGDFDNDGRLDVIGRTDEGEWWVGRNTGLRMHNQMWGRWSGRVHWNDVSMGDFDQDGDLDLVGRTDWGEWWVAVNEGYRFTNRFWGRWSPRETWTDVTAADVDGDGDTDIIGRAGTGQWWLARSTAAGFVNQPWIQPASSASAEIMAGQGPDSLPRDLAPDSDAEASDSTGAQQAPAPPASDVDLDEPPWQPPSTPERGTFVPSQGLRTDTQVGAFERYPNVPLFTAPGRGTGWLREYRGVRAGERQVTASLTDQLLMGEHLSDAAFASTDSWELAVDGTAASDDGDLAEPFEASRWPARADSLFSRCRLPRQS